MPLFVAISRLVVSRIGWFLATGDNRDAEILALRHQILVLQRQVNRQRFNGSVALRDRPRAEGADYSSALCSQRFQRPETTADARKHDPGKAPRLTRSAPGRRARAATVGKPVTRLADSRGAVSFAGTAYQAGHPCRGQTVHVAIVGGNVQLAIDGKVIKTHPIRHDPNKEHGAFANHGGRPPKKQRSA